MNITVSIPFRALSCAAILATSAHAQVTIGPLLTFGGGDGYLAPGDNSFLTSGTTERGMGFNPTNNHLYFVSRSVGVTVRVLDAATGTELSTLNTTGITGGTFALSKIVTGADGLIYGSNLRTGAITATSNYKIYRWDTEASAPTLIFDALPNGESRIGDDLDAIGAGADTRLVAGYNISGTVVVPNINSYAVIDPTTSAASPTSPAFTNIAFTGTPPNTGDFRLGITFLSGGASGTVAGTQGGTSGTPAVQNPLRVSTYDQAAGTGSLVASPNLTTVNERPMDYAVVGGVPLLATLEVGAAALTTQGTVHLYDMTDPSAPLQLAIGKTQTTLNANTNFAGDVRFGATGFDVNNNPTVTLYALNTGNGIEAFVVTIPEPSTGLLLGLAGAFACYRRHRRA